ncbi:hypothetical protein [Phaeobacter piscinae]|uniref:hypothetical protein n=1 Tax=Phaeobacter piscinae TaxID=1580596 RepID=UPI000C9C53E8|nr:hypothetical protein [Phaeobacter piscinae]AUQ75282.1 hypothetical protein PhaeoP71_02435 [Phaeobacter piscinae]
MQSIIKLALQLFLAITCATSLLTLAGVGYVWFIPDASSLPYLEYLLSAVIIEIVGSVIILAKRGLKYLPETQTDKDPVATLRFMKSFISKGTSATIVSNRVSWLAGDSDLISTLHAKIASGTRIEIITPSQVSENLKEKLSGATFVVTNEALSPEARFTLINGDRSGAEKLAIARGVHPEHEITIFDNNSGPQIIAMAKDIIRKSKEQAIAE